MGLVINQDPRSAAVYSPTSQIFYFQLLPDGEKSFCRVQNYRQALNYILEQYRERLTGFTAIQIYLWADKDRPLEFSNEISVLR
jgi:hypothetical protein